MLGERTIRTVSDVVKYSARFNAMLFEWDSERCRLIVTKNRRQKVHFIIIALYLMAEAAYQGHTLLSELLVRTISIPSFMMLVCYFSSRLIGLLLAVTNGYKAEDIAAFFNNMLEMNRRCRVYFRRKKLRDGCDRWLLFFKYFVCLQPLIPAFTYVTEYADKRYWQGAVLPAFILPFIRPCFFVVEYWISLYTMLGPVFWGYMIWPHFFSTSEWVKSLGVKRTFVFIPKRRRILICPCKLYKDFQIINQAFNECFALTMGFSMAACMGCLVLTLTGTIQLAPQMHFPGYLMFAVGALALLTVPHYTMSGAVEVTESSMMFIQRYGCTKYSPQVKIARSLMPLAIHVSTFF